MFLVLGKLFLFAFALNVVYEFCHCPLYVTCKKWRFQKRIYKLFMASFKDALLISVFYLVSVFPFFGKNIFKMPLLLFLFLLLCLSFAFFDEKFSIKHKRWEYSDKMPKVFGVGLTPLLELALTGIAAFFIAF